LFEPLLRKLGNSHESLEVRRRINKIFAEKEFRLSTLLGLQFVRAVQLLEKIGNPRAQNLLVSIANLGNGSISTNEAKGSLQRLKEVNHSSRAQ
jgi:hypothetical protein